MAETSDVSTSEPTVQEMQADLAERCRVAHDGIFPEQYQVYWRRYGKHGGKWKGAGPSGWAESSNKEVVERVLWLMVLSDEETGVI